ncbi:MAG: type II secretion system inner membrane protein GspF [Immundisolibacteraceae bacterium]|nr:type II secretion system inner membrane protein GspF [Immundisolibacteraceae bacterium]
MANFDYTALDARGRTCRGQIDAADPVQARQLLRNQQLNPLTVEPCEQPANAAGLFSFSTKKKLSSAALALIMRQLATMVAGGQPLADCLGAISQQAQPIEAELLRSVRDAIVEGQEFSVALAQHPRDFPPLYVASIAAGEKTGRLDQVLNQLAQHAEQSRALKQNLLLALAYPVLLALVATAIVIALLTYVMPQVIEVFDAMDVALPLLTRILLSISDLLQQFGWLIVLLIGAGIALLIAARRTTNGRFRTDKALLKAPLIGPLIATMEIARFTRTMGLVCGSSVPVPDALQLSASAIENRPIHAAVINAKKEVIEGISLYAALRPSGYFPPVLLQLINSGESSGNLAELLQKAADLLETEFEARVKMLVGLLEPALIVAMGGIVLLIVLAILVPILDLNTLVH